MLKKRLIPKLLLKKDTNSKSGFIFLTSNKFNRYKIVGDPISQSKIYESQKADELIILFIDTDKKYDEKKIKILNMISKEIFMPLTIGGGINNLKIAELILEQGADKISLNTVLFENFELIKKLSIRFGSQAIVASIDYIKRDDTYYIYNNKTKKFIKLNLLSFIKKIENAGCGEILLTNVHHDGTSLGLDVKLAKHICKEINIPIIISGGCGKAIHIVNAFKNTCIEAVSAGTFFAFQDQNLLQARSQVKNSGINLR